MSIESDFLEAFETHSAAGIRACLARGASATELIKGKRPIDIQIEMYSRSSAFADCLRTLMEAGAEIGDPLLEAVLLDDEVALGRLLAANRNETQRKLRVAAAYTSCLGVTALHLCAEFNCVRCGRALLDAGADIEARADVDDDGLGGQTPLFHCVNSNRDHCRPMMEMLVDAGADLDVRLRGLVWGVEMEWETVVFDVTPMSYAQCGLYAQFHRPERDVYNNLDYLYRRKYGVTLPSRNVPNRYVVRG